MKRESFFTFMRAQLSSQIGTWVDNSIAFSLKKLLDFLKIKIIYLFSFQIETYVCATIVGQLFGGITNCIVNYRWTFKALEVKKRHIAIKYILVWIGSLCLNTFGTYRLTEWLRKIPWLVEYLGHRFDDVFIVPKLFVAVIVGFVWNYNMHRLFVYRNRNFRKYFHKTR